MAQKQTFVDWIIFIFLCITWGSSFILIKKGLISFAPAEVATIRICITALAFLPIYFFLVKDKIPLSKLHYVALAGLLGNGIPAFLYAIAQTHVQSSVAGILNSLSPIFTWIAGMLFFSLVFKANQLAGVLIGFAGAAAIILLNHEFAFDVDTFTLFIVLATLCYGFSANIVQRHLQNVNSIALTAVAMFVIAVPSFIYSFFTDIYTTAVNDASARTSILSLITLSLIGTALANILFYRLIQRTSALFASSVAYLIPVTALAWGVLDGEKLAVVHLVGLVLILGGIYLLRK